jgi:hypothetical protein
LEVERALALREQTLDLAFYGYFLGVLSTALAPQMNPIAKSSYELFAFLFT